MPEFFPLPSESPLQNIDIWIGHLLGAIELTLDTPAAWDETDAAAALGFVEDLKVFITELPTRMTPTGAITQYAGAAAPDGWLLCDGAAVSRTTYAALFAVLGTTYGAGNGTTTFNLPDMRGRGAVGAGQGASLTNRVLGASGGAESVTLTEAQMPAHNHELPPHVHPIESVANSAPGSTRFLMRSNGTGTASNQNSLAWPGLGTAATASTGGGGAHNNMQPFLVVNHIIKA